MGFEATVLCIPHYPFPPPPPPCTCTHLSLDASSSAATLPHQKDRGVIGLSKILLDVRELKLRRLKHITSEGIQSIASKSLKYLNLRKCDGITDAGLMAVVRNCPNIERLNVCELHKLSDTSVVCVAQTLGSKLVRDSIVIHCPPATAIIGAHHPSA